MGHGSMRKWLLVMLVRSCDHGIGTDLEAAVVQNRKHSKTQVDSMSLARQICDARSHCRAAVAWWTPAVYPEIGLFSPVLGLRFRQLHHAGWVVASS